MVLDDIFLGCNGLSVLICQKMLACCGLYDGMFDGSAGNLTVLGIMDFQGVLVQEGKIDAVTGICDKITWKELIERHS